MSDTRLCRLHKSLRNFLPLIFVVVAAGPALAQSAGTSEPAPQEQRPPIWTTSSGLTFTLFPGGDVYPVYVADPHRPTNAIEGRFYTSPSIAFSGNPRAWLSAGGRLGLLRFGKAGAGARAWQLGIEAGMDALFDAEHKSENIGWDGNYGLTLTTASAAPWAFKVAMLHVSSHVGDEHAARTGRTRINYIRQELAVGATYRMAPAWRFYGEVGGAYDTGADEQEPWRVQGGAEYEAAPRLLGGRFAWYAAGDLASWQERDWRVDSTIQAGIVTRSNSHTYRLLIEYVDGRPQVGEFYKDTEGSLGIGLRIDF